MNVSRFFRRVELNRVVRLLNGAPLRKITERDVFKSLQFTSRYTSTRPSEVLKLLKEDAGFLWARHVRNPGRRIRKPFQSEKATSSGSNSSSSSNENGEKEEGENNEKKADGGKDPNEERLKEMANRMRRLFVIALFIYGLIMLLRGPQDETAATVPTITWSDFTKKLLPTGQVSRITVFPEKDIAFVYVYPGARAVDGSKLSEQYRLGIPSLSRFEAEVRAIEAAVNLPPEHWTHIEFKRLDGVNNVISLAFVVGILGLLWFLSKRIKISFNMSDMMSSMTKAQLNILDPLSKDGKLKIKFKDVAGLHEAKMEIAEFVDYLKNPQRYTKLGAKLPKGALLTGPPGCGKTLLAKALAAESSAPFISINGTEFVEMIGGLGASRVRGLFKEAKSRAPCIIYIDEIDAIGRKRGEGQSESRGNAEEEQTLNQLLVELDGMDTNQGVILIASTNRPDILDKALTRRGRFDRHISVDLPTLAERKELFELYLKKIKISEKNEQLIHRLALLTPGADISNVVNESAIHAATNEKKFVHIDDINYALTKVIAGSEKRSRVLSKREREVVAYHESGHALVGWLLEHTDALLKVTIVPRTSAALGFAQYTPQDRKLFTKEELFDRMCMMLGGRAAENVVFGSITTGAQNDLERVTKQAYAQVQRYGMSEEIGPLSFAPHPADERAAQFQKKPYSKQMGQAMDMEAQMLVTKAYQFTENLLKENFSKLETLAKELLAKESLSYDDVKILIGPPTFGDKSVVDLPEQSLPNESED